MDPANLAHYVRPRVIDHGSENGEPVRIEDAIESRIEQRSSGILCLVGPPGSGRRRTLEYVRLRFADRPEVAVGPARPSETSPPVVRCVVGEAGLGAGRLELVPWSRDEWIEYLLANHPAACASVMARLEQPEAELDLKGRPLLWAAILDELARDPALPGVAAALRSAVRASFPDGELHARAKDACLRALLRPTEAAEHELFRELAQRAPAAAAFVDQGVVQVLLGAERLVSGLAGLELLTEIPFQLGPEVLKAARGLLLRHPAARDTLERMMGEERHSHASAASLLHLYGPTAVPESWRKLRPRVSQPPRLSGAHLPGLEAREADLHRAELGGALLSAAQLDGAELAHARLGRADLSGASLRGARLRSADAPGTRFVRADLRGATLEAAELANAVFDGARLEEACLQKAKLEGASLRGARLDGADLCGAVLRGADVSEATFTGADLSAAVLDGVDLRRARLTTRLFASASLVRSVLEEVVLEEPDLTSADLSDALLTASRFVRADLRGAKLVGAGLAQVHWEHANLMKADLTHASFHLGSTRSGLLIGAPASWGTRTGFYTERQRERDIQAPEQVRKANLRGADLRAARIFEADFYLVDLRGALYTPDQERHLRACGAIL